MNSYNKGKIVKSLLNLMAGFKEEYLLPNFYISTDLNVRFHFHLTQPTDTAQCEGFAHHVVQLGYWKTPLRGIFWRKLLGKSCLYTYCPWKLKEALKKFRDTKKFVISPLVPCGFALCNPMPPNPFYKLAAASYTEGNRIYGHFTSCCNDLWNP